MIRAVENVRDRLLRAVQALEAAGVPYAIAGGNAVAAWVSRIDASAVRNTRDVDVLLRRADLAAARRALETAGFVYRRLSSLGHTGTLELFLDGAKASAREAIHVVFAREKVRPDSPEPSPDVADSELGDRFRLVSLEALVRMKLAAFRDKDRTHLRDLIDVGLIDASWLDRLPSELRQRLQLLLDTPEG
jgi:Nucleotidyl transferase AbiEii toxin, Type IV TA system